MIAGRHCSRNGSEYEEGCRKVARTTVWQSRRSVRVKALVVAVLTVEACSREKGKVSRPSKWEMILLEYYIEFGHRNQESRVYFGMSSHNTVSR